MASLSGRKPILESVWAEAQKGGDRLPEVGLNRGSPQFRAGYPQLDPFCPPIQSDQV